MNRNTSKRLTKEQKLEMVSIIKNAKVINHTIATTIAKQFGVAPGVIYYYLNTDMSIIADKVKDEDINKYISNITASDLLAMMPATVVKRVRKLIAIYLARK